MLRTMYPKLKNEIDPNHMSFIGTGWEIEKLQAINLMPEIGSFHGYVQGGLTPDQVFQGWETGAADRFFNGKRGPWIMEEWGFPSTREEGMANDNQYQLSVYQSYIPALLRMRNEGYNLIGSYAWIAYDFLERTVIPIRERTNGLMSKDGVLKSAGQYLAQTYADLRKQVPAP